MADDIGERTEPATGRRREQAVQRGQVAVSRDLTAALILLASIVGFQWLGEDMMAAFTDLVRYCLSDPWMDLDEDRWRVEASKLALLSLRALAPWLGVVMLTALIVQIAQTGGLHAAGEKNYLDFSRLNPISGLQRLFSLRGLIKTLLDTAKVVVVGWVAYLFIAGELHNLAGLAGLSFNNIAGYAFDRAIVLAYQMVSILLVLGIADYAYQRYQYEQDLKMTRQEVKEEYKDLEGDPAIRMRRRRLQMELARKRMISKVPEAEVVITNPTELAIALKYDPADMDAPVLVAKGAGIFAKRIRDLAAQHGIPLIENKPLAQMLFRKAELDRVIPEDSFVAVAEILAYVYQISGKQVAERKK